MNRFHLVRMDPESNTRRFYTARVQATLFGTFALVREWGCIGSPGGPVAEFGSEPTKRADWLGL